MSNWTNKRKRVFARDDHRCVWCGSTEGLTVDHVIPTSQGGNNSISNLQTLCGPCNILKGADDMRIHLNTHDFLIHALCQHIRYHGPITTKGAPDAAKRLTKAMRIRWAKEQKDSIALAIRVSQLEAELFGIRNYIQTLGKLKRAETKRANAAEGLMIRAVQYLEEGGPRNLHRWERAAKSYLDNYRKLKAPRTYSDDHTFVKEPA